MKIPTDKLLIIFDLANNHMGSVEHGLKIIRAIHKAARGFPYHFAVKFQYRQLDTFIHPDFKNRYDFKRAWVDDNDLIANEEEVIAAPTRIDRDDLGWQRMEVHCPRHAGADRNIEIDIRFRLNALLADHRGNPGSLLARKLGAGAGLTGGGVRTRVGSLRVALHFTAATLVLSARAARLGVFHPVAF